MFYAEIRERKGNLTGQRYIRFLNTNTDSEDDFFESIIAVVCILDALYFLGHIFNNKNRRNNHIF
jgi:thiaminase